ncbi:formylglycine-generating enzyme family protein [Enterococcus mundtii]|uniref:Serine/threonine protein phosphatase n=1 Tax=Enterococcus mundtii TaxID=53346 RepID=A0A1V2UEV8_ENTMU|nr:formylglycine-generating enzyme family protein [Enterococcus mundtii]MEC3942301.1 formylglycine-generating enzyme family protein [Enterococcus mundtii]ONN41837.1 serine/threonine protein phosphatase [Enterococcus mundtii]
MITIPKGTYQIGTNQLDGLPTDREGPKITLQHSEFSIDETTVTNKEFARFVSETGYLTEAEKFGWSFVFHYFLSETTKKNSQLIPNMGWWYGVKGADWSHPEGPDSSIETRWEHPVVQVSRNDAVAYCLWAGKRLPTEAEWEIAAKGGTKFEKYYWGENFLKNGKYQCNIWQGDFPQVNTMKDGFSNTAPAKWYEPNDYGMYQPIGNVWEWCSNLARIDLTEFQEKNSTYYWSSHQTVDDKVYSIRGGSFLCHERYCNRYRITARNGNTGMSASNNLGFRCVK